MLPQRRRPLEVLCFGAHSDDIEIGCGGTLLHWIAAGRRLRVRWVVLSGTPARAREARRGAVRVLRGAASAEVIVAGFRDSYFPYDAAVKDFFEQVRAAGPEPDVVFTHFRGDRHQDHRVVSDLAWNTFRDHLVLEYEIPKYDGDLSVPNAYVELSAAIVRRKLRILREVFGSQRAKRWFSDETFHGLLRLRGIECAARSGCAEAFHVRKAMLT
jgi:LmbE family N-acetylglucosaminyl deacetylase